MRDAMLNTLGALCHAAAKATVLTKLTLSRPTDPTVKRAVGTLREIKGETVVQIETFLTDNKVRHENLPLDTAMTARLAALFADFGQINLLTTLGNCEYRLSKKGNPALLGGDRLARALQGGAPTQTVEVKGNNNEKKRILSGREPFLALLGVADATGRIHDKKQPKFRQINRFLELVSDTLPHLPAGDLKIADLCCGKSYLSFAVYHYFTAVLGRRVEMIGVDLKPDVVDDCNEVARKLGFTGLCFVCDDVKNFKKDYDVDLVVSLHACDIATDLVLDRALCHKARVILSTPCCHHELNHTLHCQALAFIEEHSMLRQKLCDAATDALRLKWLESQGYDVAALELIDPDDTPKNVMLRALRRADAGTGTKKEREALAAYRAARAFLTGDAALSLIGSLSDQ